MIAIKILFVEDLPTDVELAKRELLKAGIVFRSHTVDDESSFIKTVETFTPDVIISDYKMPHFDGMSALKIIKQRWGDIPFIILTGSVNEEVAVDCMKAGAWDYILKEHLSRLPFAVTEVLNKKRNSTEKLNAEKLLRESEERWLAVMQTANDAIISLNGEGKLLGWNKGAELIFGYSEAEALGKNLTLIFTEEIFEEHFKRMQKAVPGMLHTINKKIELVGTHKNGKEIPIELSLAEIYSSQGVLFTCIIRDITDRKLAEQELHKLSLAMEQSPVSVVITKITGEIEYVNTKFCELTGYTKEEAIGQNSRILKSKRHPKSFYKELWDTILSGKIWHGEILNKKKNGEHYWESAVISPMLNKKKEIINFVAVKENITEKKAMIEELHAAKNKAEEMNRLKSNFLANMSHELRTPLNGILGYSEILTAQLESLEQREMAQGIFDAGNRLKETLTFILDLSDAETDKMEVIATTFEIIPIVKKSIELCLPYAEKKNLKVTTLIKDEKIIAPIDAHLFERVLHNLLDNAVKFTRHGEIIIEIGKEIHYETVENASSNWFYVKIADTGIGIGKQNLEYVWEEFRQVSEGLSREYEGLGLGLTISKKAVELMGGKISVESELGVGSTFCIKFPALEQSQKIETVPDESGVVVMQPQVETSQNISQPLLLYVEDDAINRTIVELFLRNICKIEFAENGATAIALTAEKKYDLILMDINLGGEMNGLQAVTEILKMPAYQQTPIIAVTAYAMGKDRADFIKGGCTDYLAKPFHKKELIQLVEKALAQSKSL